MAFNPLRRMTMDSKYLFHLAWGKTAGISHVIRYLRNPSPDLSIRLLRDFGASIGKNSRVKRSLYVDNSYEDKESAGDFSHLRVGNNCYIGDEVFMDLAGIINIGDNVVISGRVSILTHADCNRSAFLSRLYPGRRGCVNIEDGAWLGFGTIVLPGVTIGKETVVAAGSVVAEDIEPRSLYAGTPAKKIKDLFEGDLIEDL